MDAKLHDYTERNPPRIQLTKPILHPNDRTAVIGHAGSDKARDVSVATFPRNTEEHWFRGESASGLKGYGVSEDVLDRLDVQRVIIIETDTSRVIEFDRAAFEDATMVAYSPKLNESVIGDDSIRVDSEVYHDRQRVLPVDRARQVFDRNDVRISQ